jgi:hypothetical protein
MRDLYSNIAVFAALASASRSAAATGDTVDLLPVRSAAFIVNTGSISADGDFEVGIEESDNGLNGWAVAPDEHVQTDAPTTLEASSVYRVGYLGWKRFIRLSLAKAGGTSIQIGAVAVTEPLVRPADA